MVGTGAASTMATAGVDGTIRLWDMEGYSARPSLTIIAHDTDVNVISWNPEVGRNGGVMALSRFEGYVGGYCSCPYICVITSDCSLLENW